MASLVQIWKQDPAVTEIGIRKTYIYDSLDDGPTSKDLKIEPPEVRVPADVHGNFLLCHTERPRDFDIVHTFAVAHLTLGVFRRATRRLQEYDFRSAASLSDIGWHWGTDPLRIFARAGRGHSPRYVREDRALYFYVVEHRDTGRPIYTCQSFDLVAHETGHAILDGISPVYHDANTTQAETLALRESFGDLAAILTLLSQLDACDAIISESKCDLRKAVFLPSIAEEYGRALNRGTSLRNAANEYTMSDPLNGPHEQSQVFTGAIYESLCNLFDDTAAPDSNHPADTLFRLGEYLSGLVLVAFRHCKQTPPTFRSLAQAVLQAERSGGRREVFRRQFHKRGIL